MIKRKENAYFRNIQVINPDLDKAILYETFFDYETLIDEAINTKETLTIRNDINKFDI